MTALLIYILYITQPLVAQFIYTHEHVYCWGILVALTGTLSSKLNTEENMTVDQARKQLQAHNYTKESERIDAKTIAVIMKQILCEVKSETRFSTDLRNTLYAIAMVLDNLATDTIIETMTTVLDSYNKQIEKHTNANREILCAMEEQTELTAAEVHEELVTFRDWFGEDCKRHARNMGDIVSENIQGNVQQLHNSKQPTEHNDGTPAITTPLLYAAAVATQLTKPMHMEAISRGDARDRQIVITLVSVDVQPLKSLTEKEIIEKANLAITNMNIGVLTPPEGTKFIGARKLNSGDTILSTNSQEAGKWIRKKDVLKQFNEHFGSTTTAQANVYLVVLETYRSRSIQATRPTYTPWN